MKYHKAKQICFAVIYGEGKHLKWSRATIHKMMKHRVRHNNKMNMEMFNHRKLNMDEFRKVFPLPSEA